MEAVIRDWIERFNAGDFDGAFKHYSFPITYNGQYQTAEEHLQLSKHMKSLFPSHVIEVDTIVSNSSKQGHDLVLGVRNIVTTKTSTEGQIMFGLQPGQAIANTAVRVQDLWMVRFVEGLNKATPKIKELFTAPDAQGVVAQLTSPPATLPEISSAQVLAKVKPATKKHDLVKAVRNWAKVLATKTGVSDAAAVFMHDKVYYHDQLTPREEVVNTLNGILSLVGVIHTDLPLLAVDEEHQRVAVRYVVNTELIVPFAGMTPNGRTVGVPENCIYQFSDGKVLGFWNSIDVNTWKAQMA
jgi:predicted ester cyclase